MSARAPLLSLLLASVAYAQGFDAKQWNDAIKAPTQLGVHVPELNEATLTRLRDAADAQPRIEGNTRLTAWRVLAFSGTGSGLRTGRYKRQVKRLILWLRANQNDSGLFISRQESEARHRSDHLIATLAIARTCIDSSYKLLNRNTEPSTNLVIEHFRQDDAKASDTEVMLLAVLTKTLAGSKWQQQHKQLLELTRRHADAIPAGKSRRGDAVRHLVAMITGEKVAIDLTLAKCWPGDLARDPLHTWLAAFLMREMPKDVRRKHWPQVEKLIAARVDKGKWPKTSELDADTTTAVLASAIGMLYIGVAKPKQEDDGFR